MLMLGGERLDASPSPVFVNWPSSITNVWQSGQVTYTNSTYPSGLPVSNAVQVSATFVSSSISTNITGFSFNPNPGWGEGPPTTSDGSGPGAILLYFIPGTNSAISQSYTNTLQIVLSNPPGGNTSATNNIDIVITPPPPNNPVFTGSFSNQWSVSASAQPVAYTNLAGCRVAVPSSNSPTQFPVPDITNVTQVFVRFLSNSLGQTGNLTSRPLNASNNYFATSNGFGIVGPYTNVPSGLKTSNPWASAANLETVASVPGWYDGTNAWVALNIVPGTNTVAVTNYLQLLAVQGNNNSTLNWTTNDLVVVVRPVVPFTPYLGITFTNDNYTNDPNLTNVWLSFVQGTGTSIGYISNNSTNITWSAGNTMSDPVALSAVNANGGLAFTSGSSVIGYISYGAALGNLSNTPSPVATNDASYQTPWVQFELTRGGTAAGLLAGDVGDLTFINEFSAPLYIKSYDTNGNLLQYSGFGTNSTAMILQALAAVTQINPQAVITNNSGQFVRVVAPVSFNDLVGPYDNFHSYITNLAANSTVAYLQNFSGFTVSSNANSPNYNFTFTMTNHYHADGTMSVKGVVVATNTVQGGSTSFNGLKILYATNANSTVTNVGAAIYGANYTSASNTIFFVNEDEDQTGGGSNWLAMSNYMAGVYTDPAHQTGSNAYYTVLSQMVGEVSSTVESGLAGSTNLVSNGGVSGVLGTNLSRNWWTMTNPLPIMRFAQTNPLNYDQYGDVIFYYSSNSVYNFSYNDRYNNAKPVVFANVFNGTNVGSWVIGVGAPVSTISAGPTPTPTPTPTPGPASNVLNSLISNNATLPILAKGDYILTNDVVWSSTNTNAIAPIAILTNNVGLNLNGFTIRATNSAMSEGNLAGIIISDASTVAVTNGTIRGFRRNGISVVGATQIWLGNLTISDVSNPTTNAPNFEEDLLNPTAGISIEGGWGVTVSNVVISNVSGGTNVMSVAGLDALLAPGLQVIGTTVTGVSNSIALGSPKNLCNGMSVLYSPDVVFSNITVSNVVGNSNTATANGLVTYTSANFQLLGSPAASNAISGITNYGGVAAGISGTQVSGMTVRNTRISELFTGEDWTNNLIGHTVLGMVFAPLNGYPLGITNITVTNGGSGYTSAPNVTISNVANDKGSGAKAVATVSNGSVSSVRVTATGSSFQTFPSIAFSGGGGSNAAAIVLPFLPMPSFAPVNVLYDTNNTETGGNVVVADCVVERVTGSIDDAHGISFFGVTNVVASNVVVRDVLDGTNTLGLGGSKATGIEIFGNPMVPDSKIKLIDCRVENIRAISPGDLAANGFSAAGGGITFINCTASNVSATNTIPGRQPAYGYGYGWAPDIRLNYQYPAWNVVHSNSTAIDCDYGFDTFNHRNASYLDSTNISNRIANFLVQPSTPGQVGGTERIFFGAVWNQVYAATNGPIPVSVWNTAQNNNTNGTAPAIPLNSLISSNTTCTVRVPGSYNLTNGVLWGSTNIFATAPLVLAGNNISLDLGGNAIVGSPASFTDAGLVVGDGSAAYTGLVISNGVIDGFSEYGVFVEGVPGAKFSALQILNTGGIITATSPLPNPLPAGFYAMVSPNVTLSNVVVSNVTSGVNSSLTAGVGSFGCSNFTAIGGTIADVRGVGVPVLQTNNAVFGFLATESPGVVCSNLSVSSISGSSHYKDVTGIAMLGSSHSHVYTSTVTGVTNDGGTAQGINGSFGTVHMKVVDSRVSHIRTGQEWTNNPLGHTALGMVFTPSGRPVRSFITGITLTNSGSGYTSAPTVTLQTLSGDPGTNATAFAVVGGGRVIGTGMLNGGSDYIAAPKVVFSGGGGNNAAGLVMPHNVCPYTTYPCGDITVSNCVISNVVGGIDDAHGISFFAVTNVVADNVRVDHVLDGTNTMGPGGSNIGGSKATGIESYGNPSVANANFQIRNSHVEDIHAISPGDLAAIGFSAAGGGINFYNCAAVNVRVTGTNRLTPGASPGRGYGFAWAPDIRVVYQYPARGATFAACTASFCDVGFDTFNFQGSIWYTPTSISNRITDFLVEPSVPFLPEGTVRVLYGSYWNEVLDAPDYPGGIKGIPVWNNSTNNVRTYASGLSGLANWAAQSGQVLPAPGTPAYNNALFAYAFSGGSYQGSNSIPNAPVSTTMSNVSGGDYLVLTENIRTDDPSLVIWGESQTLLTNTGWNDADVTSAMSTVQSNAPAGTQYIDFITPRGTAGKKFLRLKATYVQP